MGYYSSMVFDFIDVVKANAQKCKEIEDYFSNYENNDVYGFADVKLELNEKGELIDIGLSEYYAKFYDDRLFVTKLSEAIETGTVFIRFTGEDGETWGYIVKPNMVLETTTLDIPVELVDKVARLVNDYYQEGLSR